MVYLNTNNNIKVVPLGWSSNDHGYLSLQPPMFWDVRENKTFGSSGVIKNFFSVEIVALKFELDIWVGR